MASEAASGIVASYAAAWADDGVYCDPTALVEGMDFGELGDDGRLKRIVGFFGPFPPE
jgi:hypothetical protein